MTKNIITTAITAVALAMMSACNTDTRDTVRNAPPMDQTPIARNAPAADRQDVNSPITVTGCLQKAGGLVTTYIVTAMNEPSQKGVGTTGSGPAVEREQVREAANAYRVETRDKVDMDSMVGKEVRVSGTIAKQADLPDLSSEPRKMEKIEKGDLAKIDDASIAVVSDNCGGHAAKSSGAKIKKHGGKKTRG